MAFTYRIINDYRAGVPQTPMGRVLNFLMVALHDTEGGVGDAGARGTIQFLIDRADRNASYHEIWAWNEATKTFTVFRIVRTTSAAHSLNPFPPSKGGSYEPDATVRAALGTRVGDPNAAVYAVSIAGKVGDVNRWSADPDFVAACKRRLLEIKMELGVSAKAEHFRFNPSTRTDWGQMLTPALSGERVWGMLFKPVLQKWNTKVGAGFYTDGPGVGIRKTFSIVTEVTSIAESEDFKWRILAWNDELLFAERAGLDVIEGTRNPATGYGAPTITTKTVEVPTGITQTQLTEAVNAATANALLDGEAVGVTKEKSRLRTLLGL